MDHSETRNAEIQQALDSGFPALALCRLKWLKVISSPEAELKRHLANDLFTYVCDLEGELQRLKAQR